MKKILLTILSVIIFACGVTCLAACDNDGDAPSNSNGGSINSTQSDTALGNNSEKVSDENSSAYSESSKASATTSNSKTSATTSATTSSTVSESGSQASSGGTNSGTPTHEHTIVHHEAKAATCTEGGNEAYDTCENCDYTTYVKINALGHDFATDFTIDLAATCTAEGSKSKHCSRCEETDEITVITALGHDYVDGVCTRCEDRRGTEGLVFTPSENGESYIVSGYEGSATEVYIPKSNLNKPVTAIAADAFKDKTAITLLVAPDTVENIGLGAFSGCSALVDITLPFVGATADGLCEYPFGYVFGTTAYSGGVSTAQSYLANAEDEQRVSANYYIPSSLKNVTVTGGELYYGAFLSCANLASVVIKSKIETVRENTFFECSSLISVELPDSLTMISYAMFYNAKKLKNINIPEAVKSIGGSAFFYCNELTSLNLPSGLASIGDGAFSKSALVNLTIPNGVTSLGGDVFYLCGSLKSIDFGTGVANIGYRCFYGCSRLEEINLNSVKTIGTKAFWDCTGLKNVYVSEELESFGDNVFLNCTKFNYNVTNNVNYLGNKDNPYLVSMSVTDTALSTYTLHSNTRVISENTFKDCSALTSIVLPSGVKVIAKGAFSGKSGLTEIIIPSSVTRIGASAFSGCSGLETVTLSEGLIEIGAEAFLGCGGLTSVTIPNSVTSIEEKAFYNCGVESLSLGSGLSGIGSGAFENCAKLANISVSADNVVYSGKGNAIVDISIKTLLFGCKNSIIPTDGSVTAIGDGAFRDCKALASISIPSTVTNVGAFAFYNCTATIAWVNPTIEIIGANAFNGYKGNSLIIPSSVKTIQNNAYTDCTYVTAFNMPRGLISIEHEAFSYCVGEIIWDDNAEITVIGAYAFQYYQGDSFIIPESVTEINHYAFSACNNLKSITFENTVNWHRYSTQQVTSNTLTDVSNPTNNLDYLTNPNIVYYFKRLDAAE